MRLFSKLFRLGFALGFFLLWYMSVGVYVNAERTDVVSADAAIVLGAAAWGNRPSPILRERINHAIQLYEAGAVDMIIFTGGQGLKSADSEAAVAQRYAIGRGVPASATIIEDRSTSTIENLANVKALAAEAGIEDFLIVSNPQHMWRAIFVANQLGLEAYSSPTRSIDWIQNGTRQQQYVREVAANLHHRLLWPFIAPSDL